MKTRADYDKQLEELKREIIRMGALAEQILDGSIKALSGRDLERAQKIIDSDDEIDELQLQIEERCVTLIATQQPMAGDLRAIFAAIKMGTDLERIADYGVDIAKTVLRIKNEKAAKLPTDLPRMMDIACRMLLESVRAYANANVILAIETAKRDDMIDLLFKKAYGELLDDMRDNPWLTNSLAAFVLAARYLERIGDHITNVCEWIVYNATGKRMELG